MKEITKEMREQLRCPLPTEAVKPHPTKTYLSTIKAIFVTERLSDVFGVGVWQIKVAKEADGGNGMVVVKVIFSIPEYGVYYECFGGNDNGGEGSKNFDLGDAYKGATTDAITKIGSWLEIGIDVFKGAKTPSASPTKKEPAKVDPPSKPFITKGSEQWKGAVDFMLKGGGIADIKAKYQLLEMNENELIELTKK